MVGYVPPPQGSGRQKDREAGDETVGKDGWLGEAHRAGSDAVRLLISARGPTPAKQTKGKRPEANPDGVRVIMSTKGK